jgi:DNA ligase (NAD+)
MKHLLSLRDYPKEEILNFISLAEKIKKKPKKYSKKLKGKSFVFTGTMKMDRIKAQEAVRSLGGEVSSSVSENTSYVVVGENAGSKLDKARELEIQILNEYEFLKLVK